MTPDIAFSLRHTAYRNRRGSLQRRVLRACEAALRAGRAKNAALSVMLTDDARLRGLNHDFRGKDKPTNVLAFPAHEADYLGDIAISLDTVAREAAAQNKAFDDHLTHLAVHGTLHLLGHDHENDADAARMETLEINILQQLGINNPYL